MQQDKVSTAWSARSAVWCAGIT